MFIVNHITIRIETLRRRWCGPLAFSRFSATCHDVPTVSSCCIQKQKFLIGSFVFHAYFCFYLKCSMLEHICKFSATTRISGLFDCSLCFSIREAFLEIKPKRYSVRGIQVPKFNSYLYYLFCLEYLVLISLAGSAVCRLVMRSQDGRELRSFRFEDEAPG